MFRKRRVMKLHDVKVGDTLIRYHFGGHDIVKVYRTTKTQIILDGGSKYRKDGGYAVGEHGSNRSRPCIRLPGDGEVKEIQSEKLHARLVVSIDDATQIHLLRKMTLNQLRRLHAAILKRNNCNKT